MSNWRQLTATPNQGYKFKGWSNGKTESEMQRFAVPAAGIYFVRVDNRKNYRNVVKE